MAKRPDGKFISRVTIVSEERLNVVALAEAVERFGVVSHVTSAEMNVWDEES